MRIEQPLCTRSSLEARCKKQEIRLNAATNYQFYPLQPSSIGVQRSTLIKKQEPRGKKQETISRFFLATQGHRVYFLCASYVVFLNELLSVFDRVKDSCRRQSKYKVPRCPRNKILDTRSENKYYSKGRIALLAEQSLTCLSADRSLGSRFLLLIVSSTSHFLSKIVCMHTKFF